MCMCMSVFICESMSVCLCVITTQLELTHVNAPTHDSLGTTHAATEAKGVLTGS